MTEDESPQVATVVRRQVPGISPITTPVGRPSVPIQAVGLHLRAADELTDTNSARNPAWYGLGLVHLGVSHD